MGKKGGNRGLRRPRAAIVDIEKCLSDFLKFYRKQVLVRISDSRAD